MKAELVTLAGDTVVYEGLDAYFRTLGEWDDAGDGVGLLPAMKVVVRTLEFQKFHPLVQSLRGIVLDDPGTSDHHVVLCRAGVTGAVLHLAHDGASRIVFDSLGRFQEAAHRAANAGGFVDDEHPNYAPILDDQAALRSLIVSLRSEPEYGDVVPALVPSLDLADLKFLSMLVGNGDPYVAEAVCREIAARPAVHLMPVARLGEEHAHWMVRNAGALARQRILNL